MKALILAAVAAVCFVSLPVSANTDTTAKTTTTTTATATMSPVECKDAMAKCTGADAEKCKKDLVDNKGCAPEVK